MKAQNITRLENAATDVTDDLLSTLSHELRTPLAAILLWTKLLSEHEKIPEEELKEGLRAIRECAEEQDALIDAIVDSSRIATGKIHLKNDRVDLVDQVECILKGLEKSAADKKITIEKKIDPFLGEVLVDAKRLQQVVHSLMQNAIKHTPATGRIVISAQRLRDVVELRVEDTGCGISADKLPFLFDRFPGNATPPKGNGSTLYTVARLVDLLDGSIKAESAGHDRGSAFTVKLSLPKCSISTATKNGNAQKMPQGSSDRLLLLSKMAAISA